MKINIFCFFIWWFQYRVYICRVKGGLATPLLKDIQTHLGGDALNVKPQMGFLFMRTRYRGNSDQGKRARKMLLEYVRRTMNYTGSLNISKAVTLYTQHHNIDLAGKGNKEWLYGYSPFLPYGKPYSEKISGVRAKKEKKVVVPTLPKIKIKKEPKTTIDLPTMLPAGLSNERFFRTGVWKRLRKKVMEYYGCGCMRCGNRNTKNHVDHIYPRSKYPELELEFCNMQILCKDCNELKSNIYIWDLRPIKGKKWIDELASKGLIKPAVKLN